MYRKYHYNNNYFSKIDSKDKAYFLGLLYADGNVYLAEKCKKRRNRVQITLINEDSYILQSLLDHIRSNSKMYIDKGLYSKVILDSKQLTHDLISLGCIPNKSLILKFPTEDQLPKNLQNHFIRGYFDGDGCISLRGVNALVSFTSTSNFCNSLIDILKGYKIECTKFRKRYQDKLLSAGSIYIGRREYQKPLYEYLYRDCGNLFLKRKKDKFDKLYEYIRKKYEDNCGRHRDT